jgi:uncharacterized protein
MNVGLSAALVVVSMIASCGCQKKEKTEAASAPSQIPWQPTQAQPRLQTLKLWLGAAEITAELALTQQQVQTGMMFRTEMGENDGMLFVFGGPHQAAFWMKNTKVPLSAAYIDPEGTILEIHDLQPHNTNSVVAATGRVQYVLETPQGWYQRHNVSTGAVVRSERGSLQQTFFRNR